MAAYRTIVACLLFGAALPILGAILPHVRSAAAAEVRLTNGSVWQGTIVSRGRDTLSMDVPLFERVRGQWYPLRLTVPTTMVDAILDARTGEPPAVPGEDASQADRVAAAEAMMRRGVRSETFAAAETLLAQLWDDVQPVDPENDPPSAVAMRARVATGLLRFRLLGIIGTETSAVAPAAELLPFAEGSPVIAEYGRLILTRLEAMLLEPGSRADWIVALRTALRETRAATRTYIAREAMSHDHNARPAANGSYRSEVLARLAEVRALVETPHRLLALRKTERAYAPIAALDQLLGLIDQASAPPTQEATPSDDGGSGAGREGDRPADPSAPAADRLATLREHLATAARAIEDARDALEGRLAERFVRADIADHLDRERAEDNAALILLNDDTLRLAEDRVRETVRMLNDRRQLLGLMRLEASPILTGVCGDQAGRLRRAGRLDHTLGGNPAERARRARYNGRVAEALYQAAETSASAADALAAWTSSPGHHALLVDSEMIHIGVGVEGGMWCLITGAPS